MEQPEGFRVKDKESFVLQLRRALYGLKQAGLPGGEPSNSLWKKWALPP